jgi:AraC-like DNA-binding protein
MDTYTSTSPHVSFCASEAEHYFSSFPTVDRSEVMRALLRTGPLRVDIEDELRAASSENGPKRLKGLSTHKLLTVMRLIDSSLDSKLSVSAMAQAVYLSPFHFSREFAKAAGVPPHVYLTARKVEEGKNLLRATDLSIAEVAKRLGYNTQAHFTGVFHAAVGTPPGRYRHALRASTSDQVSPSTRVLGGQQYEERGRLPVQVV